MRRCRLADTRSGAFAACPERPLVEGADDLFARYATTSQIGTHVRAIRADHVGNPVGVTIGHDTSAQEISSEHLARLQLAGHAYHEPALGEDAAVAFFRNPVDVPGWQRRCRLNRVVIHR